MKKTDCDYSKTAKGLFKDKDGVWYSKKHSEISFPKNAYNVCSELEDKSFWFEHRSNCLATMFKFFPPQCPFFDIGGGNGVVSKAIRDAGYDVTLVEPGLNTIECAKKRNISNIICSTLEDANFSSCSIASAGLFDVLEHIDNERSFLTEIERILEPNGRLYMMVPAYNFLWSENDIYAGHFRRYKLSCLANLLLDIGFEVEFKTYIFSLLPIPTFLFRTIPSFFGFLNSSNVEKRIKKEHQRKTGIIFKFLKIILNNELKLLSKKSFIPFGSSCFVIARKKKK